MAETAGHDPATRLREYKFSELEGCQLPLYVSVWSSRRESNPHALRHHHLKVACLPVPPQDDGEWWRRHRVELAKPEGIWFTARQVFRFLTSPCALRSVREAGLEPATTALTVRRSTIELLPNRTRIPRSSFVQLSKIMRIKKPVLLSRGRSLSPFCTLSG